MKRYAWIAMKLQAMKNCEKADNDWYDRHAADIESDMKSTAPDGSGFDNGTEMDYSKCNAKRLVFKTSYHHMEDGYYTKWSQHEVILTPSFDGFDMRITGRDKNMIKDYIGDVFAEWLNTEVKD